MTATAGELEFPDAVQSVRSHLLAEGVTVPVVSEVPNPRPASFVEVNRTGGTLRAEGVVDGAFVTVDCWAVSKPSAMTLARQVRRMIHLLPAVDELAGPAQLTDPDSLSPFVRQSFQVPLRGASLT